MKLCLSSLSISLDDRGFCIKQLFVNIGDIVGCGHVRKFELVARFSSTCLEEKYATCSASIKAEALPELTEASINY